ncbi:P-loop containing nucleoside triphosphate hydrolase protein [Fennellomyces sp. T-0311]|nr:P-loop containing nucleoside triphosphate hydrolase protein [Fennellomyces sp. T-0311]
MIMKRDNSTRIKIICRVRPFCDKEFPDDLVQVKGNGIEIEDLRNPGNLLNFNFASCYPMEAQQSEIFEEDVRPLIERVFEGNDATIFAYGVTGSGKTYTMEGVADDPGIIPRVAALLFEAKRDSAADIHISMSYIEIFKETVYDLLIPRDKGQRGLNIRETREHKVFVADMTEKDLRSMDAFERIYDAARRNRSTASTNLNKRSSRSHAILSLNVSIQTPASNSSSLYHTVSGKINLIDLAGSEDNRKTNNKKDRMTESASINKSLFVLGQVVEALNTGSLRIPFRDSKMTRILQPALEGSSLGMMIINIAPGRNHLSGAHATSDWGYLSQSKLLGNRLQKPRKFSPAEPKNS